MKDQTHLASANNYDADELKQFEEIASDWWDPEGKFKTLHSINPLRLQYIRNCTSLEQRSVLDVGCGGGLLCEAMAREKAIVTGIDLGEKAIQTARLHLKESDLTVDYQCVDIHSLVSQMRSQESTREKFQYDIITCLELLEHTPDPAAIIQSCAELAKPGGRLFFSTLNRNIESFLTAIVGAEYVLKVIPKNTHHYDKFIRPSELAKIAQSNGLKLASMIGISYNPLTDKFTLSNRVRVNYLMSFRKI